jgi:hypothetical protein
MLCIPCLTALINAVLIMCIQLGTGRYVYIRQTVSVFMWWVLLYIDSCLVVCTVSETDLIRRTAACGCLRVINNCDWYVTKFILLFINICCVSTG